MIICAGHSAYLPVSPASRRSVIMGCAVIIFADFLHGLEILFNFALGNILTTKIMATTTARRRSTRPMSYYWGVVKDMDDSQKLELVTMLIESVKPIQTRSLADMPMNEEFPDMDKELYTPEEAYELTMKDIKAIYDRKDAI